MSWQDCMWLALFLIVALALHLDGERNKCTQAEVAWETFPYRLDSMNRRMQSPPKVKLPVVTLSAKDVVIVKSVTQQMTWQALRDDSGELLAEIKLPDVLLIEPLFSFDGCVTKMKLPNINDPVYVNAIRWEFKGIEPDGKTWRLERK